MILILRSIIILLICILCWQIAIYCADLPNFILPSPIAVFSALYYQAPIILQHIIPTLFAMLAGFLGGIVLGSFAAILLAFYRPLSLWLLPLLIISQAIPTFAIAPLLVIWFGFGLSSKIITTIIMVFFPIVSNFYDGLQRTPKGFLDLAKSMQASHWRAFFHIRIPIALPALASGIRIAAVSAPIGAIVSEWVGSSQGLGYLMLNANARMQIDNMFAVLLVIIGLALLLYFCVDQLLRQLIWWK